jgi:hypothetical protein
MFQFLGMVKPEATDGGETIAGILGALVEAVGITVGAEVVEETETVPPSNGWIEQRYGNFPGRGKVTSYSTPLSEITGEL